MIIENFTQLQRILGENVSIYAHSNTAKIVYVNGNKIVLPLELKEITKEK